jgi:hypothetical protein
VWAVEGYESKKYNRVHYNHDHLPPKIIVRDYRFLLHYPDLIGVKQPEYTVEEDGRSDGEEGHEQGLGALKEGGVQVHLREGSPC